MIVHVQTGDTLQGLAARHLGDASRWLELAEANGLVWPYLDFSGGPDPASGRVARPGATLTIPDPDGTVSEADIVGSDLRFDGARGLTRGAENLQARLIRRLVGQRGSIPHHPDWGSRLWTFPGRTLDAGALLDAQVEAADALRRDPAVTAVIAVRVHADNDAIRIDADVETALGVIGLEARVERFNG